MITKEHSSDMARPKLGIALSGGGFRASFYHLGVLANLAQQGMLKHVEVLSCVSGGSIIGSLYYLYVKRLLEQKLDRDITDQDYIQLVAEMETHFVKAVQKNLRMRTFLNPFKNLKMSLVHYSRSDYIGELYDKYLYRGLIEDHTGPVRMKDLKIRPVGNARDFHPLRHNHYRQHKIPILLLNATLLNNGHAWRFDAARMGEPPSTDHWDIQIDKNMRLERPNSYEDTPHLSEIPLGIAVAASACVPGIFPPLSISGMYGQDLRVELVDGGVYDNQGVQGLLDPQLGCTHFIVSDACGQLNDLTHPSTLSASVLSRTNGIMMEHIRELQLNDLLKQHRQNTVFLHLRKGLSVRQVPWVNPELDDHPLGKWVEAVDPTPSFHVNEQVQLRLSRIRTDLDAFSEVEASALMMDGYLMTEHQLRHHEAFKPFITDSPDILKPNYRFLSVRPWMSEPTPDFIRQLSIGEKLVFKVFHQSRLTFMISLILCIAVAMVSAIFAWNVLEPNLSKTIDDQFTVKDALLWSGSGLFILLSCVLYFLIRYVWTPNHPWIRLIVSGIMPAVGSASISLFIVLHLTIYNRIYLNRGRLSKLKPHQAHLKQRQSNDQAIIKFTSN